MPTPDSSGHGAGAVEASGLAAVSGVSHAIHETSKLIAVEAFTRAITQAEPALRRAIGKFRHLRDSTDDILQSTWLRAWQSRHQYCGKGSPGGWLFRICQSVMREARRGYDVENTILLVDDMVDLQSSGADDATTIALVEARLDLIAQLSKKRREILRARFETGLAIEEVAAQVGCRSGTVKATVHQAREWLRQRDPGRQRANDEQL